MPPGPQNLATEFSEKEVPTPHLPAFTEGSAFLAGLEQLRNRRLLLLVHIRYRIERARLKATVATLGCISNLYVACDCSFLYH